MLLDYAGITDRLKADERIPAFTALLNIRMISIHRNAAEAVVQSKIFLGKLIVTAVSIFLICTLLACFKGEYLSFLCGGVVLPVLYAVLKYQELDKRILRNQRTILREFPEFVNRLALLVNAGEPIQKALISCCGNQKGDMRSPLARELNQLAAELTNNISFVSALENFGKRCGVPEAVLFTAAVLLHYKRGGDDLVVALSKLVGELWDRRKSMARTLGEEASSKLVFPMVFIFFIMMIIIATPAILAMNF